MVSPEVRVMEIYCATRRRILGDNRMITNLAHIRAP